VVKDTFRSPLPPIDAPGPIKRPLLAPAWVALLSAWLGLIMLILSAIFPFLPGTRDPRAELEHYRPYSLADRFLPVPIYGIAIAIFLGIVPLWQMRKEPHPLPQGLLNQRAQAWTGIVLSLIGAVIIYMWVALHGPRA
jgi:hypothetical protein